jgi:cell division protein FtsN
MARRSNNSRRNASTPGWVWMMFGLGLGLLVAIGVYLRSPPAPTTAVATARSTPAPAPKPPAAAPRSRTPPPAAQEASENRFDFYEILPQFEVDVASPSSERNGASSARAPQPIAEPGRYLLQAGSFSAAADADKRQASLALLGIESQVQRVTIDSNVFHRVRIGPTTDLDALNRTRRQLRDAGIEAVVMKAPE